MKKFILILLFLIISLLGIKMAKDYSDIGLNDRLQSANSVPAKRGTESFNPPTDFESQVERGAVTRGKLGTLTADLITGGTMSANYITGGTMLAERLSAGTIDTTSITIQDSAGSAIIDSEGLVSISSFSHTGASGGSQTFTSGTVTDITGSEGTLVVSKTQKVLCLLSTDSYITESAGNTCDGAFWLNMTILGNQGGQFIYSGDVANTTRTSYVILNLAASTYIIKAQGQLTAIYGGTPSMTAKSWKWNCLTLGH